MTIAEVEFLPQKYTENESFLCYGYPEPHIRRQEIIFHFRRFKWYIQVTFHCEALHRQFSANTSADSCLFTSKPIKNKLERRREFQSFILGLDFSKLQLLPNTIIEVALMLELTEPESSNLYSKELISDQSLPMDPKNRFSKVADRLRVSMGEDPLRIIYPLYVENTLWPKVWESDIQKEEDITGSAFRVKRAGEKTSYIYKIVDRPFYYRNDTYVFLQELQNLKLFRNDLNIVQLRGIVISTNPYQTTPEDDDLPVIRGFLLEYHPYGTLEERLEQADLANFTWKDWPLQIGYGLLRLHQENITHMDLKPSNIVIGIRGNALLIDISGIGGVTFEWMAPEVQNKIYREVSLEEQKLNDVWAYGKVLSAIARSFDCSITQDNPHTRIDLPHAISELQRFGKDQGFS